MAAFSHNGEPGSALDRELRGLNCRGCDWRSARITELERELAAAQEVNAKLKAENSKLRSALELVHFKREPWQ